MVVREPTDTNATAHEMWRIKCGVAGELKPFTDSTPTAYANAKGIGDSYVGALALAAWLCDGGTSENVGGVSNCDSGGTDQSVESNNCQKDVHKRLVDCHGCTL